MINEPRSFTSNSSQNKPCQKKQVLTILCPERSMLYSAGCLTILVRQSSRHCVINVKPCLSTFTTTRASDVGKVQTNVTRPPTTVFVFTINKNQCSELGSGQDIFTQIPDESDLSGKYLSVKDSLLWFTQYCPPQHYLLNITHFFSAPHRGKWITATANVSYRVWGGFFIGGAHVL